MITVRLVICHPHMGDPGWVIFDTRASKNPHQIGGGRGIRIGALWLQQAQFFRSHDGLEPAVDIQLAIDALLVGSHRVHRNVEHLRDSCAG
jgi:hypothetical protein